MLRSGSRIAYDALFRIYREEILNQEKDRVASALGAIRDEATNCEVLTFATSTDIHSRDTVFVISSVASSRLGRDIECTFN